MSKIISQQTFDDVVRENIVDFSMSTDEAKQETIKQFEAQGISLANVIKDLAINPDTGVPILNEIVDKLKRYIDEKLVDTPKLLGYLTILDEECLKSIPHRVMAGKNGAHNALIKLIAQELTHACGSDSTPNLDVLEKCLRAINSLTHKQPDLFDAEALSITLKLLVLKDENIQCLTLQWVQKVSVMHEMNRQNIVNAGIIKQLKPLVSPEQSVMQIREVLAVFRYLVLDDDIRVEFGCAHEHARQIASEVIVELTKLMGEFQDAAVLADLLLTLGTLAVRQEFCTTIESNGGLKLVFDIMTANTNVVRINREALKLIRALAGNDGVKVHIVQQGVAPIIKQILQTHVSNDNVVSAALACISTLTLRAKDNSATFFETGIVDTMMEALRFHQKSKIVQRNGAWAIRNMVSRSREQCETWLSLGAENLLNEAMTKHPSVKQDIKAALRDLGCKVELKEEWTGTAEKKILNA